MGSTCYDLKYIRENLKYLIKNMGYEPVLSEEGGVFYDPCTHTHDSCINEVKNSQIFILIIGGRYGGKYRDSDESITNMEYKTAIESKIPIFTLVEQSVYNEHLVYQKNKENSEIIDKIKFPSVDSLKIFEFINEVRRNYFNNAFAPFADFSDVEIYLKKQWAGMLYDFLQKESENKRIEEMFNQLSLINKKTEMISKQILNSVGTPKSKIDVELYELMLASKSIYDFSYWKSPVSPKEVFQFENFYDCIKSKLPDFKIINDNGLVISRKNCSLTERRYERDSKDYEKVRCEMISVLKKHGMTIEEYLKDVED